jgi:outer membrane beta-barrel protein
MLDRNAERSSRAGVTATCFVIGAALVWSGIGWAQEADMSFTAEETEDLYISEEETEGEAAAEETEEPESVFDTTLSDALLEDEEPSEDVAIEEPTEPPEIWAVQRIWAKKDGRFEVFPSWGISMNDPYVSHQAAAVAFNYYITEVLAVGLNFLWYGNLNRQQDLNFQITRSFRVLIPINEYLLGFNLNFAYTPLYGKFSVFRKFIFNWDVWITGGVGMMWTRPIPVIDVEYRKFDWDWRFAGNLGIGLRIFLTRYLAIATELRDYMYMEKLENTTPPSSWSIEERLDKKNWIKASQFTNNVMWHFGICLYFPFNVTYKYEK